MRATRTIGWALSIAFLMLATIVAGTVIITAAEPNQQADSPKNQVTGADVVGNRLVVTYFHGNVRCVTCRKLEAYATEVMDSSFAAERKDSSIVYRVVNFDEDGNEHFQKDYELYSQAVILSYSVGGTEKAWKNLDKIWVMVGDKEKYLNYVRDEIHAFLAEQQK